MTWGLEASPGDVLYISKTTAWVSFVGHDIYTSTVAVSASPHAEVESPSREMALCCIRSPNACSRHRRACFQAAGELTAAAAGSTAAAGGAQRRHQRLRRRLRGALLTSRLRRDDRVVVADRDAKFPRLAQNLATTAF